MNSVVFSLLLLCTITGYQCARTREETCPRETPCGPGLKCVARSTCQPQPCEGGWYPKCVPDLADPNLCTFPPVKGNCRASHSRYYFDADSDQCVGFSWGGCGGNGNRFTTLNSCEARCKEGMITKAEDACRNKTCGNEGLKCVARYSCSPQPCQGGYITQCIPDHADPLVCTYSANSGKCRAYFPRFFYNPVSEQCERFVFGGCGGNGNRFMSAERCQRRCG